MTNAALAAGGKKGRREPKPTVTGGARERCSGAGAPENPTQLAATNHPASRNGTLWTGSRLNPHQKIPWSPVKTSARWPQPTAGRSGGLAHEFAPAQHRISSIRCLISTCSRSARFHLVSNEQWKYREQRRRGSGAMLVWRRRPSGRIKSRKSEKKTSSTFFSFDRHHRHFPEALRDVAVRAPYGHRDPPIRYTACQHVCVRATLAR